MDPAIVALVAIGAVSSLSGIVWDWLKSRRKKPDRMSIRLPDGKELSIRTDEATPEELEKFFAGVLEAEAKEEKAEPEVEGRPSDRHGHNAATRPQEDQEEGPAHQA